MQVVGFCNVNRPVFYSCMALSPNKNFEDGKAHMISRFEQVRVRKESCCSSYMLRYSLGQSMNIAPFMNTLAAEDR